MAVSGGSALESIQPVYEAGSADYTADLLVASRKLVLPGHVALHNGVVRADFMMGESMADDDRYQVLGPVPNSGLAEIYKATDWKEGGRVAVKLFHETDEATRRLVDTELYVHQLLNGQPGIVQTRDMGILEANDRLHRYVATNFAERGSVDRLLGDDEHEDPDLAVQIARDILPGLKAIHRSGLIHLDVKPSNILAPSNGEGYRITDFGIAERISATPRSKEAGESEVDLEIGTEVWDQTVARDHGYFKGTIGFVPPEAMTNGERLTPEVDVFSLGVTVFRVATGHTPFVFKDNDPNAYYKAVTQEGPVSASDVSRAVPARLDDLTQECLHTNPNDRPTLEEFEKALEAV